MIPFGRLESVHRLMGNEGRLARCATRPDGHRNPNSPKRIRHSSGSFTRALESSVEGSPTRRRPSTGHEVPLDGRRRRRRDDLFVDAVTRWPAVVRSGTVSGKAPAHAESRSASAHRQLPQAKAPQGVGTPTSGRRDSPWRRSPHPSNRVVPWNLRPDSSASSHSPSRGFEERKAGRRAGKLRADGDTR